MPEKAHLSQTPDPLCAKDTRYLIRFARNGSIQRYSHLTLDIGYPSNLVSVWGLHLW